MVRSLFRGLLIGGVMATVGLVFVGESRAFLGLGLCNKCQPTTVNAPVCNPCAQQMTCNYVPQTSYRVQYVSVPVTTYRPLMTCDPCGCQTTSMRAETTYVQRAQYVPYTSYKMVYTMPRPACATTAYYAPAAVAAPAGCSTCVAGATQATYYGPTAVGATALAPQQVVAPQVAAPVTVNYTPNYAYANGYGISSAMPTIPSAQPTIPTPGTAFAPVQRVVVPPPPTTVVTPGASSISPTYSGQTYVAPNGNAMIQPSLPPTTTSHYAAPGQTAIVNGQPLQPQIIQSAPPAGQTQIIQSSPTGQSPIIQSSPTPAPPAVAPPTIVNKPAEAESKIETKVETKIETKVDAESTDRMQPIPDPLLNNPAGPNLNKTSTPRLYDPQDKTAAAWPIERAWGYSAVGTRVAAVSAAPVVLTSAVVPGTTGSNSVVPALDIDRNPTTLGTIVPTEPAIQPMTPQPFPVPRTRDADGWRSSNR